MRLPSDFDATLSEVTRAGILNEAPDRIDQRLHLIAQGVVATAAPQDLGVTDWAKDALDKLKRAIHNELCDRKKKDLKTDYKNLLEYALTSDGITAMSSVVGNVVAAINPSFFVSSIIIYLSIWVLKRGLTEWCGVDYE